MEAQEFFLKSNDLNKAAWLSGNVFPFWSRGPGSDSRLYRGISLYRIILRYLGNGFFCVSVPFVYVLSCVVFGGGTDIMLITGQGEAL